MHKTFNGKRLSIAQGLEMLRFAANLSTLFTDRPFVERFAAAESAGFTAVEFNYVYDIPTDVTVQLLRRHNLSQVLCGMPGSPADKGLAAVAGKQSEFEERLSRGLDFASEVGCPALHMTAGVIEVAEYLNARSVFCENVHRATELASRHDVVIVIESINQLDVPGYFIRSLHDAVSWAATFRSRNFGFILDLYHTGREGLSVAEALEIALPAATHVQVADPLTRHEPNPDSRVMATALETIHRSNFAGWVGCEYNPSGTTIDGLEWIRAYRTPGATRPR